MISKFLMEQKRYTQKELGRILECSEENVVPIIRKLKEYGILKAVKNSDTQKDMTELVEEQVETDDVTLGDTDYLYVFPFVGIIIVSGRVLKCYPKYLFSAKEPKDELKQVLRVLEKYNSKEQIIRMYNGSDEGTSYNKLALLLFFLEDYYENGTYVNTHDIVEVNGNGEILWDKTINESFMLLSSNRPYYTELKTRKRTEDTFDYFKRLHECILTLASKELKQSDILDLFDIMPVNISDEILDDFGEDNYILYRIEKELNVQFNTRKQILLKAIYSYISQRSGLYDVDSLSMFGTNHFNLVWEDVCADVMDNKLQTPISALPLPVSLQGGYSSQSSMQLIDLIERPIWEGEDFSHTATDTLIPDLVSIYEMDGHYHFVIFDAKYYTPQLAAGKTLRGQPGIESITKQYLYQLAFKDFIEAHHIDMVSNCFLMPTEGDAIISIGTASLPMLDKIGLAKIAVRFLPAKMMYNHYVNGTKMDISLLNI